MSDESQVESEIVTTNDPAPQDAGNPPAAGVEAQPAKASAPMEDDDPDEVELREAQAALDDKAVEGDKEEAEGQKSEAPTKAEGKEGEQPKGKKPEGEVPMIPHPRFKEVEKERDEAIRAAHYWRGRAEGGVQPPATTTAIQQKAEPTFDERLEAIATSEDEIAAKYEAGEIGEVEKTKQLRELRRQEKAVLDAQSEERLAATISEKIKPQAPAPRDDLRLQELTAELETKHPFTQLIPDTDDAGRKTGYWDFLQREAIKSLANDRIAIPVGQPLSAEKQYALRARMAELTDVYGPIWTGKTVEEVKGQAKPAPATQPATPPSGANLSPQAKARLDKLKVASEAPPDIHGIGTPGAAQVELTDSQIAGMSDEEIIERLPAATRRKMLGT